MTRLAFALAILALMLVAGCRQNPPAADSSLQIAVTVEPNPPVAGNAQLTVTIKDASGNLVSDATVTVRGDMTHAGMTPVLSDTAAEPDGTYTTPFQWTMGGDWIVEVTARLKDGTTATQSFKYTVGGGSTPTPETITMPTAEATSASTAEATLGYMADMTMEASADAMSGMNMQAAPTATIPVGGG